MGLCKSFSKLFSAAIMMALPAYSLAQQSSTWRFEQLYSAPDGFAQFAVIYPDPNTPNVNDLNNFTLTSVHTTAEHNHTPGYVSTFHFPAPLPGSTATPARRVLIGTQAFADLNIVAPVWKCPALVYGPGDSALDHTPNEHIELEEYEKSIDVLSEALRGLVKS